MSKTIVSNKWSSYRQFQAKMDIAFLTFLKFLDKDEDNSNLGCRVKFEGDKI